MLNDPPSQPRPPAAPKPHQQVMLHIPVVRPYVTYALIAVQVVLYLAGAVSGDVLRFSRIHAPDVLLYSEFYRLLTGMLVHSNAIHLIFNVLVLYVFGTGQEGIFGHLRFGLIYLLGGLAGSVLAVFLGDEGTYITGASSAVLAMLGAELVYLYQHRRLLGERGRTQRNRALLFLPLALMTAITFSAGDSPVILARWSPIGGLVGGAALAWFIAPFFNLMKHPEVQGAFRAEDINPLKRRYNVLALYISALLALLILGTVIR